MRLITHDIIMSSSNLRIGKLSNGESRGDFSLEYYLIEVPWKCRYISIIIISFSNFSKRMILRKNHHWQKSHYCRLSRGKGSEYKLQCRGGCPSSASGLGLTFAFMLSAWLLPAGVLTRALRSTDWGKLCWRWSFIPACSTQHSPHPSLVTSAVND